MIGGIVALYLTGTLFSVSAVTSFVALSGFAAMDASTAAARPSNLNSAAWPDLG